MGTFHTVCEVANVRSPKRTVSVGRMLVDTGSEYTWVPEECLRKIGVTPRKKDIAFVTADGRQISRDAGYAIVRVSDFETVDEVVFGKPGDLRILGSRTLEGFPAVIDSRRKKLVAAGPLPAADCVERRIT